jgi:hypothetical protein
VTSLGNNSGLLTAKAGGVNQVNKTSKQAPKISKERCINLLAMIILFKKLLVSKFGFIKVFLFSLHLFTLL